MVISYDNRKKSYDSMDDSQKQQYNDMLKNKGDDYVWNQYMKQYNQQTNNTPQSNNNSSNFNNQNGTNWQNQTNFETPTVQKTESQNNNQNNQTYNYDPNEKLDTSMFGASDGKVKVQEWTAQQTWMPDYQLDSDARTREITDNLNAYWQTNREYFQDRNTYNNMFHYNERSDQQKAVLDSYWKKKEDMSVAEKYNTADGIKSWMNDADITPDQLNYIKEYSPEAYREWQQKQIDDINLRIANLATPADPTSNAELFSSLLTKLGLEPWDPYQIYDNWYDMAERLGVFSDSEKLKSYQNQLDANHSKMESIMSRYANSTWGTVSDALAAARMQKALAPYQQREVDLQNSYTTLLNGRNSNLAIANQSAQALAMQAQEDQRIWNQRLQGLGFAMNTAEFRTYEQKAQTDLYKSQALNSMELLQQAQLKDINRYDAYATAKMKNQLQQELTDLSVEDEAQLKANLNNALSTYYQQYWDIIQRSQAQTVEDIIAYAKKNWISVAQAMTENFIKPLQNKKEYKMKVAQDYWMDKYQQQYSYTIDENWNVVIKASWFGEIPDSAFATRASRQNAYSDIYDESMDWASYIQNLSWCIKDWSYGGQCGAFVNDVLVAWDNNKVFGDSLQSKIDSCNVSKSEWPQVWYAAVFDLWYVSKSDWINHGHVGIVTSVNNDWSIDVLESNGQSDETIHVKRYSKEDVAKKVKGYYKPNNYDISRDLWGWDMTTYNSLKRKFAQNGNWNENWYIESLSRDFESYLEKWKDAITDSQWKSLKEDYGMDEKDFREMAQIYAKTWLKKKWVAQAETALKSALQLQDMLNNWKTRWIKDNPQWWLIDWALQIVPRSDAGEAKTQYDTLMSQLALDALFTAKDNWATFGAMSQWEWDILKAWATNLKWNSSSWLFEKNLNNLISELTNAVSSGWWTLPQWVYNTDI